jgi:8-oxo-dGTP pyrophosphatase MutT (NUDIX family)
VRRIGAVTMLPIILEDPNHPLALVVQNKRLYYGTSVSLPGGNKDGGFENPEPPVSTALRELREETGYGYKDGSKPRIDCFDLRTLSSTIDYVRSFVIIRGVAYLGGEDDNPHEVVTPQPIPLEEYIDPLFKLQRGEIYPEVNAAFAKAALEVGREAVMDWLVGNNTAETAQVPQSFKPWLLQVATH